MVIKSCPLLMKDTETCVGSSLASYFVLFSLISFCFRFISFSFRFVSFSFPFVSFLFRFALYRYPIIYIDFIFFTYCRNVAESVFLFIKTFSSILVQFKDLNNICLYLKESYSFRDSTFKNI